MAQQVSALSSMATRGLLAELAAAWGGHATVEAVGGVDAAQRVRNGEPVDVVVLAGAAMRKLEDEGHLVAGSLVGVARSTLAVAVRTGDPTPELTDAAAVRRTLQAAERIGYSTGPSGDHLLLLLDRWDLREVLGEHLVQAPPGTPVGRLLAEGTVDLAIQQHSELMDLPGVTVAGPLPPEVALDTVFTAGIAGTSTRPEAARCFISFLASSPTNDTKRRHGMEPAWD